MNVNEADINNLVRAARRAYFKMKSEYDQQQPDAAGSDECWAEAQALQGALKPFEAQEGS